MMQGELVWVRFPYSDLQQEKIRPTLVVSNTEYNRKSPDVVVCAVTSNLEPRPYSIALPQDQVTDGKLPLPSRIRADKIMQVSQSMVLKAFCRVKPAVFDSTLREIQRLTKRE
ncbi:MAG: type II toxin-antitoxin system PemK/MazF family toxin [Candidatus Micrarchaeota archaeon]